MLSRVSQVDPLSNRPGETPFFVVDRDTALDGLFVLSHEVNGAIRQLAAVDAYCSAPKCPCKHTRLWIIDVTEAAAPHPRRAERILEALERTWRSGSPSLELELDLAENEVSFAPDAVVTSHERTLLDGVKDGLIQLQVKTYKVHRARVRAWGKAGLINEKLWASVQDLGSVDWAAIFPRDPPFCAFHDGQRYLMVDSYCAKANCTCEEVVILPCKQISDEEAWQDVGCLRVGLNPDDGSVEVREAEGPGVEEIFRSFLDCCPGAPHIFRKRRAMMRELGRLRERKQQGAMELERLPPSPAASGGTLPLDIFSSLSPTILSARPQRVSRNAPCPCGSGRKFKNCCDRLVSR